MNDNVQNGEVIIDINDLSKAFGDLKVLTNISTQIRKGDVVCVIGPSGSGKSTFLRCMNLLETPTGGHIYFEGTPSENGNGIPAVQPVPAYDDS